MLSDAFLFTMDSGGQVNSIKISTQSEIRPPTSEAKVFHHMEGMM